MRGKRGILLDDWDKVARSRWGEGQQEQDSEDAEDTELEIRTIWV